MELLRILILGIDAEPREPDGSFLSQGYLWRFPFGREFLFQLLNLCLESGVGLGELPVRELSGIVAITGRQEKEGNDRKEEFHGIGIAWQTEEGEEILANGYLSSG